MCENIQDTIAGLVLPLQKDGEHAIINDPKDLNKAGLSLIGWLGRNRAFYSFLDSTPSFEVHSDCRTESLRTIREGKTQYTPLFIVQRKARLLPLSDTLRETIQRLLELVYKHKEQWQSCFDYGMRDWTYQVTDFASGPNVTDEVLNGLTDMAVPLGGETPHGRDSARFSNLFLPPNTST